MTWRNFIILCVVAVLVIVTLAVLNIVTFGRLVP